MKKCISVLIVLALVMTVAFTVPSTNAYAAKKCSHKSKITTYVQTSGECHYEIVKCKKCGKVLQKNLRGCYSSKWSKLTYSRKNAKRHNYKCTCKCGRVCTGTEPHTYKNGKCIECGQRQK